MTLEPTMRGESADVLFLIHDLALGGAERVFVHYVNHLDGPSAIPVLVRPRTDLAAELRPDLPLLTLSRDGRVEQGNGTDQGLTLLDRLADRSAPGAALSVAVKTLRLRTIARRTGARCVSTFLHKSHIIGLLTRDLLAHDLRVVINVHEMPSQHLLHHFRGAARWAMRRAYRWAFRRADALFVVAEGIADDLVTNFGAPPDRIRVLRNPLDLGKIRAAAREPVARGPTSGPASRTVVGVGRLVPLKGFDVLLRAITLMETPDTRVVLIGDGPERGALEALARRLGLNGRVRFAGSQSNPWRYMAAGDVVALPSRSEGFPNVLGEALALGIPVVAADAAPGIREYLEDGACGLLVTPENPAALARALDRVLTDADLRRSLTQRGLERVAAFDLDPAVDAYRRALVEVMAG